MESSCTALQVAKDISPAPQRGIAAAYGQSDGTHREVLHSTFTKIARFHANGDFAKEAWQQTCSRLGEDSCNAEVFMIPVKYLCILLEKQ